MKVVLLFDGSCQDNGSASATARYGWVVRDELDFRLIETGSGDVLERRPTNNVAEWRAVIEGLRYLASLDTRPDHISIRGDSKLVIKQLLGEYKCREPRLAALRNEAWAILSENRLNWSARWIPRGKNFHADKLAR